MAPAASHPELQLLFACARVSPDLNQVGKLAASDLNWNKLAKVIEFHGLTPLFLRNLKTAGVVIPADVLVEMERWNGATVRQNLFLTSELLRIHATLRAAGIEAVPLKGAALASQVYHDLGLRPFSDIDLLIRREQIQDAESAVKGLGYEAEFAIPAQHRGRWLKQQCELTFRRSGTIRLELHWDIAQPYFALNSGVDEFWSRLGAVRIGDATLPNLSPQDLLFTLIVHGTRHAWSRMMWLVDVAELLGQDFGINWEKFWRNAESRGAARMMATGLALARQAFGVSVLNSSAERAYGDERANRLAEQVIANWGKGFDGASSDDLEPTAMWRHRWAIHNRENRRERWAYARNVMMMVSDEEFTAVRLPAALAPLYQVVRFWNIFRRARPRPRAASAQSEN
jgi:hypothetical protein